jgi:hypothetical protein
MKKASSGILGRVALVRPGVSEERTASIIRVRRTGVLGELSVTSNRSRMRSIVRITVFLRSVLRLLVTATVVPSSPIFVTLMMEALRSSETWALNNNQTA